jgi:hypothetical protein
MAGRELLSDTQIKKAMGVEHPYKLNDRGGLYLLVHPRGSKYWRFRYKVAGRESMVALGTYPATSCTTAALRDARRARGWRIESRPEPRLPVDLTVVSGYSECFVALAALALLRIAMWLLGMLEMLE